MDDAIYARLVTAAAARQFVFYPELAEASGFRSDEVGERAALWQRLAAIDRAEVSAGRPMLSSICVQPQDHLPGPAFFALGRELGMVQPYEDEVTFATRQIRATHDTWSDLEPFGEAGETG